MKEKEESKPIDLMLGYLCVATEPEADLMRKVEILDRFGLTADDISKICECPKQSVLNARAKIKKGKRG